MGVALAAIITLSAGCAAMEKAQQDWADNAITVSRTADLASYRRVGVERLVCRGPQCRGVNGEQVVQTLRRQLTKGCYEPVDATEMERYAGHFGSAFEYDGFEGGGFSLGPDGLRVSAPGMDVAVDGDGMRAGAGGMEFTRFPPDLRDVVISELGLDGIVKTSVDVGEPDDITRWRATTVNVELVDAHGFQTVWQGQLTQDAEDGEISQVAAQLADALGGAIGRRASACYAPAPAPVAAPAGDDHGIAVVGEQLQVPGRIYFELGSARLSPRSNVLLDDLTDFMLDHAEIATLTVEGHTDDVGDDASNLALSQGRAQAVVDYLVAHGVAASRVTAAGFGETRPRVANDSAANRALNRRVEFRIVN
ncbi:MAG: hypothetical protein CVU56_06795 [Deltaproteobacteria bacterium HGW-Deltaproteobacteria-14]|nr:MAG: hypothetical protein CVU56_06795 [Deltaproteobacteria bacterium HGW-Deltaproteobacteria-14]